MAYPSSLPFFHNARSLPTNRPTERQNDNLTCSNYQQAAYASCVQRVLIIICTFITAPCTACTPQYTVRSVHLVQRQSKATTTDVTWLNNIELQCTKETSPPSDRQTGSSKIYVSKNVSFCTLVYISKDKDASTTQTYTSV